MEEGEVKEEKEGETNLITHALPISNLSSSNSPRLTILIILSS